MGVLARSKNGDFIPVQDLATAASAAYLAGATVVVNTEQTIDSHISWPADRSLEFQHGGFLTITETGSFKGLSQAKPQWFGAKGNAIADDTKAIQMAVEAVREALGTVIVPKGVYKISSTIDLSDGVLPPPNFRGETTKSTIFAPTMLGTTPCFRDKRTSMTYPSKQVVENFTIKPQTLFNCTGIEVSGAVNDLYKNILVDRANYGFWLHDDSGPGTWTEVNFFENCWTDYCNNGLRLEQGSGNGSFHGNTFDIAMNIGEGQIGINHVSGYYYNGRFQFYLWATAANTKLIQCDGNAENNIGDISVEIISPPGQSYRSKIDGSNRWWYTGEFNFQGGPVDDLAGVSEDGASKFSSSNYIAPVAMNNAPVAGYVPQVSTYNPHGIYNGTGNYGLFKLMADGVVSFLLNNLSGHTFFGTSGWNEGLADVNVGLSIRNDGGDIQTYHPEGMSVTTGPNEYCAVFKDGQFYVGSPDRLTKVISALGNPEGLLAAAPGSVAMSNLVGEGSLYLKKLGTVGAETLTGWKRLYMEDDLIPADTLDGYHAAKNPQADQIPVISSTGGLTIPGDFAIGATLVNGTPAKRTFCKQVVKETIQDILIGYNDYWSGTLTVIYNSTGLFTIKQFQITLMDGRTPVGGDFVKLKYFYPNTMALGVPYVKFLSSPLNTVPHLYVPLGAAAAGGVLTVIFESDIAHHPTFMPDAPAGTLGATPITLAGL